MKKTKKHSVAGSADTSNAATEESKDITEESEQIIELELDRDIINGFKPDWKGLSYTSIGTHKRCPASFFLAKIAEYPEEPANTESREAREKGKILHHFFNIFYDAINYKSLLECENDFQTIWKYFISVFIAIVPEKQWKLYRVDFINFAFLETERFTNILETISDRFDAVYRYFKPVLREAWFQTSGAWIKTPERHHTLCLHPDDPYGVRGYVDVVYRDPGAWHKYGKDIYAIGEYKTGSNSVKYDSDKPGAKLKASNFSHKQQIIFYNVFCDFPCVRNAKVGYIIYTSPHKRYNRFRHGTRFLFTWVKKSKTTVKKLVDTCRTALRAKIFRPKPGKYSCEWCNHPIKCTSLMTIYDLIKSKE
jgi:hypothetical protein